MLKRVLRRSAIPLLVCVALVLVFVLYLRSSVVPERELDSDWYHTPHHWRQSLAAPSTSAVIRAQADHFIDPVGPRRAIRLVDASSGPSDEVYLRFVARWFHSSYDIHALIVYCWSTRERRFIWKAVEDHSA